MWSWKCHLVPLCTGHTYAVAVTLGAGLAVLYQLGILGKHGVTIEKEARMHCRVNARKQYLVFPALC